MHCCTGLPLFCLTAIHALLAHFPLWDNAKPAFPFFGFGLLSKTQMIQFAFLGREVLESTIDFRFSKWNIERSFGLSMLSLCLSSTSLYLDKFHGHALSLWKARVTSVGECEGFTLSKFGVTMV